MNIPLSCDKLQLTTVAASHVIVQVLRIVHLGAETKGGFFPEGTKGGLSPAVDPVSSAMRLELLSGAALVGVVCISGLL